MNKSLNHISKARSYTQNIDLYRSLWNSFVLAALLARHPLTTTKQRTLSMSHVMSQKAVLGCTCRGPPAELGLTTTSERQLLSQGFLRAAFIFGVFG